MNLMTWTPRLCRAAVASGLLLILAGCSGMDVERTRNSSIAVPSSPTYAWAPGQAAPQAAGDPRKQAVNEQIRRAIETVLQSKGYRQVSAESADFLVEYQVGTRTALRQATQYQSGRQGPVSIRSTVNPGGGFGPPPTVTSGPVSTTQGSLMIVIRQRASGQVFYQALGREDDIREGVSEAQIQSAVRTLLSDL